MESSAKHILCVDDHEDTCQVLTLLLREYEVVTASSLSEAMRVIENQPFDLYILDNWLGGDSGVELCRYIKTADPNTPVIFCSGVAYEKEKKEALQAGAQAYLVKPVEPSDLQTTVKKQLDMAEWRSLEAKVAEIFAIKDCIGEHLAGLDSRLTKAGERMAKVKALQAFREAGGNRASFERLWSETWHEATGNGQPPV